MHISRIDLSNFRGFKSLTVNLPGQFTVIAGDNGSGKTTVLEALAVAMGGWLAGLRVGETRHIRLQDVRLVTSGTSGQLSIAEQYPVEVLAEGALGGGGPLLRWARTLEGRDGRTTSRHATAIRRAAESAANAVMAGSGVTLPVLSYYGAGRLWQEPNDWSRHRPGRRRRAVAPQDGEPSTGEGDAAVFARRLSGYRYSVDPRCSDRDLMRWIRLQRLIELDEGTESTALHAVLDAVQQCLPLQGLHYSMRHETLLARTADGSIVPFRALSDGYRNIIALVGDIAYKCSVLNPDLTHAAISATPGIVLIDELDLHLHPQWQRKVVGDLRSTFPSIQFVATTHSPFVIQSVRDGELVNLSAHEVGEYADRSIEDIAENVMGVPIPQKSERYLQMVSAAEAYLRLLRAPAASVADRESANLRLQELSLPYSDDPAFQAVLKLEREAQRMVTEHAAR